MIKTKMDLKYEFNEAWKREGGRFEEIIETLESSPEEINYIQPIDINSFSPAVDYLNACCQQPCTGWQSDCGSSTNKHD
jgi:hypothetical protein